GNAVKKDQVLVTMDQTDLIASKEINKRDFSLTQARLRTAINESFVDKNKRTEVPILEAQLAIDQEKVKYTDELLNKTEVRSPIAGIVIFDSKEDWVGQPVQTGERVLMVADPNKVKLRISLPVNESIKLTIGNSGKFFVQGQLLALPVKISLLGYNAKLMPNKILAYQLEAIFTDNKNYPQIGAQGTVKLYGQRVPLIYYLLRRPIQALRQNLGI
ncbi:MAG TPA: HlyD family efflux transporter periplasmic adaptor subunit, partial [Gammaproteobacteria bacterium]|nr:HlyD family efflux transporter periplasmic adaptor subunit [Gammaproteobacteria bacterium]